MRILNFNSNGGIYTTKEGVSYTMNNNGHNIQRIGETWLVDGIVSSLDKMEKMGIATKI